VFTALPLAARIGGPILLAAILAGGWYLYKESLRSEGRDQIRAEHAEEVQAQQETVRMVEQTQYDQLLEVVERTAAEKDRFYKNFIQERRKVLDRDTENQRLSSYIDALKVHHPDTEVKYVETQTCLVPEPLTARVDELARVLNAIPYRGVPENDRSPAEPALQGSGPATCAQLLGRIEVLTARLGDSLIAHRGLTEYVEQEKAINAAFHVHQREIAE